MVTPTLGPTGEPVPPDPQAGPVRDGDGPQPDPNAPLILEEAEVPDAEADTSLADPSIGEDIRKLS